MKALSGNPYDGHTLATVIPDMEALVGNTIARILADKGYRGHNTPPDYKFGYFSRAKAKGDAADQARMMLARRTCVLDPRRSTQVDGGPLG